MGLQVHTHSLSALAPVKFTYKFNKEEKLVAKESQYNNGLKYYRQPALSGCNDAVLSKGNCLILTDIKPLKDIFEEKSFLIPIGTLAGCIYLKTNQNEYLTTDFKKVYNKNLDQKLFVNAFPISKNVVELKINSTTKLIVDKEYPYEVKVSQDLLAGPDLERQRFEIDYSNQKISFKTKTAEGYRYLSCGADGVMRATGLMLNDVIVNNYLFTPEFVSSGTLQYNFDPKNTEIKYYNEIVESKDQYNVAIKTQIERDTNLLISCSTPEIAKNKEVSVNIALLKTNFSSSGSYLTK
jgi:hypothetical protein